MSRLSTVRQGQVYTQCIGRYSRATIWMVGSIHEQAVPILHARLINVTDPLRTKTISCSTLANNAFYRLVSDASPFTA